MKHILSTTLIAATFAFGAPAFAADLPVKAPPRAVVAPFNWQGFYVGGSLGARFSDIDWTTTAFGLVAAPVAPPFPATAATTFDNTSFRAGIYGGFNFMVAPNWLVGIEGDFAWADSSDELARIPGVTALGVTGDFTGVSQKWDAGIRGRIGVLLSPDWLLYATGGVAWTSVEANLVCGPNTCPVINFGLLAVNFAYAASDSETLTGWTLGLGLEGRLWGNWLARVEYRYADFGTWDAAFSSALITTRASLDVQTHTALLGLAYKF